MGRPFQRAAAVTRDRLGAAPTPRTANRLTRGGRGVWARRAGEFARPSRSSRPTFHVVGLLSEALHRRRRQPSAALISLQPVPSSRYVDRRRISVAEASARNHSTRPLHAFTSCSQLPKPCAHFRTSCKGRLLPMTARAPGDGLRRGDTLLQRAAGGVLLARRDVESACAAGPAGRQRGERIHRAVDGTSPPVLRRRLGSKLPRWPGEHAALKPNTLRHGPSAASSATDVEPSARLSGAGTSTTHSRPRSWSGVLPVHRPSIRHRPSCRDQGRHTRRSGGRHFLNASWLFIGCSCCSRHPSTQ